MQQPEQLRVRFAEEPISSFSSPEKSSEVQQHDFLARYLGKSTPSKANSVSVEAAASREAAPQLESVIEKALKPGPQVALIPSEPGTAANAESSDSFEQELVLYFSESSYIIASY